MKLVHLLTGLLTAASLTACAGSEDRGPVVLAPSSMHEVMEELADSWTGEGHARPVLSFAGTAALARQAERNAPADVIICADAQWMDWLAQRALIAPETRRVVAGNALALISANPTDGDRSIVEILQSIGNGRLAIGDPQSVPAGRYAREALVRMGLWDSLKDSVVPTENVRAALALVEAGEAQLGIVYVTDARASNRVSHVATFDLRDTPDIQYPAARLSASRHPDADAFLDFLSSPIAQEIYVAHGFVALEAAL